MKILAVHAGGFPRIGDTHEQQRLKAARESLDRGDLGREKFVDVQNDLVREALSVQARAGLDLVSDGQIRWADPVSHIMGRLEGVRIGGLTRYFDTNTYYRQPQATGPISLKGPLTADEFRFARAISPRPVTATLPGPFTLSRLSLPGGPYPGRGEMMAALVPVLAGEVGLLADAGAANIIIEEHSLVREPSALSRVEDALEVLGGRKGQAKLWLRISYGDIAPLYGALQKLPVDGLILDFTYSSRLADAVASSGSDLPLGLGIIDARNIRLEHPLKTAREVERLVKRVRGGEAWIMASTGVDFLPRIRAVEKLALLARIRDLVTGKGGRRHLTGGRKPAKGRRGPGKARRGKNKIKPRRMSRLWRGSPKKAARPGSRAKKAAHRRGRR